MSLPAIECFHSNTDTTIYRIPMEVFAGFVAYCYVVLGAGSPILIDTGSSYGDSNDHLLRGIAALRDDFGEPITVTDIERIIVTHGHIDHFGGVAFICEQTGGAQIGIHELDRRVLSAYEERVIVATKALRVYLERAGVGKRLKTNLMEMYNFAKKHVRSVDVDFALNEDEPIDGMQFYHVPGHCSGQVCIQLGDVLISADHILAKTTPHQAPESITQYTGLGHYLESLDKAYHIEGIRLTLGGHETPIYDLYSRIDEIKASHKRKFQRVMDTVKDSVEPITISDISKAMYSDVEGYHILLALEEVGAHVEHLYNHGHLAVRNLDEVEHEDNPALRYGIA